MAPPLTSWKEIAAYLNKSVRTAQRWEREFGLPIRRPHKNNAGSVLVFREELDQWLRTHTVRHNGSVDLRNIPPDGERLAENIGQLAAEMHSKTGRLQRDISAMRAQMQATRERAAATRERAREMREATHLTREQHRGGRRSLSLTPTGEYDSK